MVLRVTSKTVSHNTLGDDTLFGGRAVLYLLEELVVALYVLEDLTAGLYLLEDHVVEHLPQSRTSAGDLGKKHQSFVH